MKDVVSLALNFTFNITYSIEGFCKSTDRGNCTSGLTGLYLRFKAIVPNSQRSTCFPKTEEVSMGLERISFR